MALTDYDKKNLSTSDQKKIQEATDRWNAANAKGDAEGMKQAAADAAAVRNNAGYKTDSYGNYSGTYSPTTGSSGSSNKNTQYTGSSNSQYSNYGYTISSERGKNIAQNMEIDTSWTNDVDGSVWTKERDGSVTVEHNGTIYKNAYVPSYTATGMTQEDILDYIENYYQNNPQPTHTSKYDPEIDRILNEILNRSDFSYNALTDPLYQQYANMYQREGDRAMRDTLAEAAASAGGMNTYAITAAQQAANYYNSQLGDKIPELYQLAYEMYLADKESKVQDLGILQNMDATQYNRYRDTMDDWKNDRSFAYGLYQDAVNQGNWQTQFDYKAMWDNKRFLNDNYWKGKDWSQVELENNINEQKEAQEQIKIIIASGGTPDADLIAKSGWNQATIDALVAEKGPPQREPIPAIEESIINRLDIAKDNDSRIDIIQGFIDNGYEFSEDQLEYLVYKYGIQL